MRLLIALGCGTVGGAIVHFIMSDSVPSLIQLPIAFGIGMALTAFVLKEE